MEVPERELDLRHHLRSRLTRGLELGPLPGHPGRHHHHRSSREGVGPVPFEIEPDAERPQPQGVLRKLVLGLEVRGHHRGSPPREELRGCDARAREADDHHGDAL